MNTRIMPTNTPATSTSLKYRKILHVLNVLYQRYIVKCYTICAIVQNGKKAALH